MTIHADNPHGGDTKAVAEKLGLKTVPEIRLDFSVNINPLGPPPCLAAVMARSENGIEHYPDIYAEQAAGALAKAHGVSPNSVMAGNGSTEIMSWILQALRPQKPAWIPPCYAGYEEVCLSAGITGGEIDTPEDSDADLLFLTSPNNPTGEVMDPDDIFALAAKNPDRWMILDESFMDFVEDAPSRTLIRKELPRNIIVLKSLTKFFAIPGLRLGMAYAHPDIIGKLNKVRLPWSVNAIAQQAALKLYDDQSYIDKSRATTRELRKYLSSELSKLDGFTVMPSHANFVLIKLPEDKTASELQAELLKQGILIRSCANFSRLGEQHIRLATRPKNEIDELIKTISNPNTPILQYSNLGSSLMILGTTSDAGKTIVAAALCRYFARKGKKVAPFKAQNMALNSFVTAEGGEMGRAQVVQAQAAGIEPHTDMNPVLLKPMGDAGSQVIVNGKPIGNFPAKEYYEMKEQMKQAARDAYDRLSSEYEMIILEGAGSPAEINLMEEDFVNMAMAEYADADVILVADIDRGGVFASIYGTIQLIPEKHRRLVKGIIINKFRGDESLLEPGIKQIEDLTGIPVLGVLPYIRGLNIEEEDSLGLENRKVAENAILDIAVVRFPRISNYTDFLALENTGSVSVRYVERTQDLGKPDLVILPGTKNTRADLHFIQEEDIADAILKLIHDGVPVFGICGGYQMLGSRIADPSGVEGEAGEDIGLNLLPVNTVLEPRKELAQVKGHFSSDLPFAEKHTPVQGYEIHAGRTSGHTTAPPPITITERLSGGVSEQAGTISEDGLVFGCYIHGIFDGSEFREQLLDWLCERKNITPPGWQTADINDFDRLADLINNKIKIPHTETQRHRGHRVMSKAQLTIPPKNTRFFCSWSGGKDSCLAAYRAMQAGSEMSLILTMLNENRQRSRSHGLTPEVLRKQAECIGAPIMVKPTTWEEYESTFIEALHEIKEKDIHAGVFGDIDFPPHLEWEEKVCTAADITPYLPLWKASRRELLNEFLSAGFKAMIVTVQQEKLDQSFLGKIIDNQLVKQFEDIGIDPCGENGEYHTVVIDGPIFSKPLKLTRGEIVQHSGYMAMDVRGLP